MSLNRKLRLAAVFIGLAGFCLAQPVRADVLQELVKFGRAYSNVSKITEAGIKEELTQELKNQLRNDASSRNLRVQNKWRASAPIKNRWARD